MRTALLINTTDEKCGVHAYGHNLWSCLEPSDRMRWWRADCTDRGNFMASVNHCKPDVVVYNHAPLIGGYLSAAPFPVPAKQVLIFHDNPIDISRWDAVLFSDPTMASNGKWHSIGRPIPQLTDWQKVLAPFSTNPVVIGVHGFMGAQAHHVVAQVIREFDYATVRLSLPFSPFCDGNGQAARAIAETCRTMANGTGIHLQIAHDFLGPNEFFHWLSQNTINCYFRDYAPWTGVSSAPDSALAVCRPLAVNKCSAFRHLHNCSPSICVEDSSLKDIIANGLKPLEPLYEQWSAENVRRQVEDVLLNL